MLSYDILSLIGAYLLVSTILYRIPRGGPSNDTWRKWIGIRGPGSVVGAVIWALGTSAFAWYIVDQVAGNIPYWTIAAGVAYLLLAETFGWSDWWPNRPDGGDMFKLSLRGVPLLNPFMGIIYFKCYEHRDRLWEGPEEVLHGWTEYAEVLSGFVTAAGFFMVYCLAVTNI